MYFRSDMRTGQNESYLIISYTAKIGSYLTNTNVSRIMHMLEGSIIYARRNRINLCYMHSTVCTLLNSKIILYVSY